MPIPTHEPKQEELYLPLTGKAGIDEADLRKKQSEALDAFRSVSTCNPEFSATANFRSFVNIDTDTSVRTGITRRDYEFFRPFEAVPQQQKQVIGMCMQAYQRVGLVRNIIDLMEDFACQGVKIVHEDKKIEAFFKKWWRKVGGKERSGRFMNMFYRAGNVIILTDYAKLKDEIRAEMTQTGDEKLTAKGAIKQSIKPDKPPKVKPGLIPWKYTILNPLAVEAVGGDLAQFIQKPQYAVAVPPTLIRKLKKDKNGKSKLNNVEVELLKYISQNVLDILQGGGKFIPLDPDRTRVYFYKKDDYLIWAYPMMTGILDQLILLKKMELADLTALDGAISNVRIWTLGDLEKEIIPSNAAVQKLATMLTNNVGGGTMDLIWGPDLKVQEYKTEVYKFLGEEKYKPTLNAIYAGLGIPPTLTGAATAGGFTNNYISLKTLIERLEYGRSTLLEFWNEQIDMVCKAMGFKKPARVVFDHMSLSDESAEKALLIQLADRNLISMETIHERFGEITEIERSRMANEDVLRNQGDLPTKIGPYEPDAQLELKKILLTQGGITPSQAGVKLSPNRGDQEPFAVTQNKLAKQLAKAKPAPTPPQAQPGQPAGQSGPVNQGRPKNAKDSKKRKKKRVLPRSKANRNWVEGTFKYVREVLRDSIFSTQGAIEPELDKEIEELAITVVAHLEPYESISQSKILKILKELNG